MAATELVLISLFAALTAVGAFVAIPIGEVPITLQSLVAMLAGAVLGAKNGAGSQIVYLAMGTMGLPVFAGAAGGVGVLLGPTGGYLLGFVACAFTVGLLRRPGSSALRTALSMVAGVAALYALGVAGLVVVTGIPFRSALAAGVVPFVPGDLVKVSLAVALTLELEPRLSGRGS